MGQEQCKHRLEEGGEYVAMYAAKFYATWCFEVLDTQE
jgi:hypothetical protein